MIRSVSRVTASVSRVTAARAKTSSVFQLFPFLVVCSGMSSKGLGFVAFFASVEDSYVSLIISHAKISVLETFNVFKRVDFFLGFFLWFIYNPGPPCTNGNTTI